MPQRRPINQRRLLSKQLASRTRRVAAANRLADKDTAARARSAFGTDAGYIDRKRERRDARPTAQLVERNRRCVHMGARFRL